MYVYIVLILLAGFCTCLSKPASPSTRNADEQSVTVEPSKNPVDLGSLHRCNKPQASKIDMGVCSKYVDYSVPVTLLNPLSLSNTLFYISSTYYNIYSNEQFNGYDSTECAEVVLKYMCSLYFPKCEGSTDQLMAEFLLDNCDQEIRSKCASKIGDKLLSDGGICYIDATNVTAAKCKRSSEYTFRKGEGFCSSEVTGWSDVYLTDLMYVQLQQVERLIEGNWRSFNLTFTNNGAKAKRCTQNYAKLACRSVGKCWDQGRRAEMTATKEDCNRFVECSNFIQGFNCSNFPSASDIPSTPPTPVTESATLLPLNSAHTGMVYAEFLVDVSSSSSLHSPSLIGLLFLSVLMAAGHS